GDVIDDAYWEAYGKYDTEDLRDLIGAPSDSEPYDVLEYYAEDATQLRHADESIFEWTGFMDGDEWYFQNETADSWPTEVRGTAQAQLNVDIDNMAQGESICVMIVLLVTYPGSGDPKDDPYNGENIVVLEKGKKCFTKGRRPEVTLVKTPQVRWAGEKVVLEQDWSDYLGVDDPWSGNTAEYRLDQESIGVLYGAGDNSYHGGSVIRVDVNGTNPTSEVVLESEFQGKADVEVALYYYDCCMMDCYEEIVLNYGFPVLFLAFEDVTSACDITPEADRLGLTTDPGGEDADVAVQVRGWFTSEQLGPAVDPDTLQVRAEKLVDTDGDGVFDRALPRGRYVLPDDWPALAGGPFELRPNWDLMDMANEDWGDSIQSTNPLGPYNTQFVANEDPEEVADAPCIGPFNTLQQWSTDDMWFAEAVVPADFTIATPFTWPRTNDDLRTTVVPDGKITEYDCPMPQALVIFNVQPGSHEDAALSELLKTDLYGYGYTGLPGEEVYHSPFYQVEVPTSEWIPAMGYNWDSWNVDGPYPYWTDLTLLSILANTLEDAADLDTDDVEVYCDNHGIAAVQIDALEDTGVVWITATADFPMSMKKGQYPATTSDPLRASWGEILEIDPDLEGTPRTCEEVEGCIVTFENLSEGGQLPYKSATWDFGDGSPLETYTTGPEKDYGGTVTHQYTTAGQFIVCITIVDADDFEATQCEGVPGDGYIKVGVPDLGDLIDYYMALNGDPNVVDLADLMAAADDWIAGTIPAGFTDPITTIQLMALADEWIGS
ncbi:MAG: PKD domain-containing protein, partial [Dehalococcoidia bacterium]